MGTMVFGDLRDVRNDEIKRIALLVALDAADVSDDLDAAKAETDPKTRKTCGHEADDFLRSTDIYHEVLTRLSADPSLNSAEKREVSRLLTEVGMISCAAIALKAITA